MPAFALARRKALPCIYLDLDVDDRHREPQAGSSADSGEDTGMKKPDAADLLEVLACDISVRPKEAPSIFDLARHVQKVERTPESIGISFASAAAADVAAFVEAERLCCAGIGWRLQVEPTVLLTIGAAPAQLDVFEQMFQQA
jgi:hypothetical protein